MSQLQTKTAQQWTAQAKSLFKEYIFYEGYCIDITQFKYLHPGGAQVIKNYLFKDVTHILFTVFPHNKQTTPKMLQKYRIGLLSKMPQPRVRQQGTILKQRDKDRQNSFMKKSVQFPSEVRKLASEKERKDQMKRSRMKNSKSKGKNSIAVKTATGESVQDKKSKRTKNINQDYLQALKGTKNPNGITPTKSQAQIIEPQADQVKQQKEQVAIQKFDSGQLEDIKESTVNCSIKKHIQKSWGSIQDFTQECVNDIKVPVLNVRLNRIW